MKVIEIPVLTVLTHILIIILCYGSTWLTYRYILYSDYRWRQRGNICYEHAVDFTRIYGTVIFIIVEVLINGLIQFSFE